MGMSTLLTTIKAHESFLPNITSFTKVKGREHVGHSGLPLPLLLQITSGDEKDAKTNQVKTRKIAYSP